MTEAEIRQKCGWVHLPDEIEAVLATLPLPRFAIAAAHLLAEPPPESVFLWDACKKVTGGHLAAHDQDGVGCCVGEGFSSAVEYLQCVEIALGNEPEEYRPISSESVYGLSRVEIGGGRISGDGSTGAWAADGHRRPSGVRVRGRRGGRGPKVGAGGQLGVERVPGVPGATTGLGDLNTSVTPRPERSEGSARKKRSPRRLGSRRHEKRETAMYLMLLSLQFLTPAADADAHAALALAVAATPPSYESLRARAIAERRP